MEEIIVNKVAESGLETIDLKEYYPEYKSVFFDIKEYLFKGLILKEKDFRESLKGIHWENYKDKNVAIGCSVDAIVPVWAYMLIVSYLEPFVKEVVYGSIEFLQHSLFLKNLSKLDIHKYEGKRVVIKGCGDIQISEVAFVELTRLLRPVVKSIMYGEPCSTVPIYKSKTK